MKTKKIIVHAVTIPIIIAAAVGGMYWWRNSVAVSDEKRFESTISDLEKTKKTLTDQLTIQQAAKSTSVTSTTSTDAGVTVANTDCASVAPSAAAVKAIQDSIGIGDGSAIQPYLKDTVTTVLAASEYGGLHSSFETMGIIAAHINDTNGTWNFALGASELSSYAHSTNYGQYFDNTSIVGISDSTYKMISLSFDCDSKIDTVFLVNSYKEIEW